jgi:hypothetical protein
VGAARYALANDFLSRGLGQLPQCMLVCHRCDNRQCVRLDHLFVGTHDDNQKDKARKGRACWGTRNPGAVMADSEIREIRTRYAKGGISQRELAREYGVSQGAISAYVRRTMWSHLT